MSIAMGPAEDLTERFIAESRLVEEKAAIVRRSPPPAYSPRPLLAPPSSPALGLAPSCPLSPAWATAVAEHLFFATPPSAYTAIDAAEPVLAGSPVPRISAYGHSASGSSAVYSPLAVVAPPSTPASGVPDTDILGDLPSLLPLVAPPSTPARGVRVRIVPSNWSLRVVDGRALSFATPSPLAPTSSPSRYEDSLQSASPATPVDCKVSPVVGQMKEDRRRQRKRWSLAKLFRRTRADDLVIWA